jgi:glucokinase
MTSTGQGMDGFALGIDIGGTFTKIGLVDRSGQITAFRRIPTNARGTDPKPYLDDLLTNVQQVLGPTQHDIIGIGLSLHGHVDSKLGGPILCNNTPAIRGINLRDILQDRFQQRVILNNDAVAHTMAEYVYGSGEGVARFLCLAVGTGIGGGVIIDGQPLRYIDGTAGDLGRVIIDPDGPVDVYGVRGSVEAFCGTPAIERLARELYGRPVPAHEVIAAAREGDDPVAIDIVSQVGDHLGRALTLLSPIFQPNRIALTGGTTEAGAALLHACRQRFESLLGEYHHILSTMAHDYYTHVDITLGKMRGETGVVGAVVELLHPHL